jgi:hypothetical protein
MVLDSAQVKAQMAQANEAMKQMEQQLASMPPEIREMMKKNMPNMGTGKPLIDIKVNKTGKSDNKGGYACQMVDITISGAPAGNLEQEDCVVPGDKLGLPAADVQTMRAMAEFGKEMTKEMGQMIGDVLIV